MLLVPTDVECTTEYREKCSYTAQTYIKNTGIIALQAVFRPKRSCTDHIKTLRIIVEQSTKIQSTISLLFAYFVDRLGEA